MGDAPWTFTATCPNGHPEARQSFERDFLEACLRFGAPIPFYCPDCDQQWNATPAQRDALAAAIDTLKGGKGIRPKRPPR